MWIDPSISKWIIICADGIISKLCEYLQPFFRSRYAISDLPSEASFHSEAKLQTFLTDKNKFLFNSLNLFHINMHLASFWTSGWRQLRNGLFKSVQHLL